MFTVTMTNEAYLNLPGIEPLAVEVPRYSTKSCFLDEEPAVPGDAVFFVFDRGGIVANVTGTADGVYDFVGNSPEAARAFSGFLRWTNRPFASLAGPADALASFNCMHWMRPGHVFELIPTDLSSTGSSLGGGLPLEWPTHIRRATEEDLEHAFTNWQSICRTWRTQKGRERYGATHDAVASQCLYAFDTGDNFYAFAGHTPVVLDDGVASVKVAPALVGVRRRGPRPPALVMSELVKLLLGHGLKVTVDMDL